jgi:hypothetical protein
MNIQERDESPARGWKTKKVLESLKVGARHMSDIRTYTGLDFRTINAILYALQHQGRVAPMATDTATPKSKMSFALVGGDVKPVEIVRQIPLKRRRRRTSVDATLGARGDEIPDWLVPRLPTWLPQKHAGVVHSCIQVQD